MLPERDEASLRDMIAAVEFIAAFIAGMNRDQFKADRKTQSAVIHQVLILGEAAKRVSSAAQRAHAEIPWSLIAKTRDILIHHYEGVDLHEIWRIAAFDAPALRDSVLRILTAS